MQRLDAIKTENQSKKLYHTTMNQIRVSDVLADVGPTLANKEETKLCLVGYESNFDKIKSSDELRYTTYDCDSIMQYGEYAFSRAPKILKTMVGKKPDCKLKEPYEKAGLTAKDMDVVNKMYQCK
ncbi:hypothetical protein AVEN_186019-1 [Araneus ventricosus]|uniref:Peptidase M12A domain-containing protein n=1 Tax=Araneus ventricosus TaxID=182803 RepID=A0A4Y2J2R1_ARAVE|nr:hypothetical protein AVEN_186019-1 [Araneus ventricosus]